MTEWHRDFSKALTNYRVWSILTKARGWTSQSCQLTSILRLKLVTMKGEIRKSKSPTSNLSKSKMSSRAAQRLTKQSPNPQIAQKCITSRIYPRSRVSIWTRSQSSNLEDRNTSLRISLNNPPWSNRRLIRMLLLIFLRLWELLSLDLRIRLRWLKRVKSQQE